MDYRHDFESDWTPITTETLPAPGQMCIVSDGDIVILATFTKNGDEALWIFHGLTTSDHPEFKVLEWMPCPRPKTKRKENEVGNYQTLAA